MGKEYTPAQAAAAKKYRARFTKIEVRLTPDEKTIIEGYAAARGLSASQYVKECALAAGTVPSIPPTIMNKPQPPAEIIQQGGNVLIMWLIDNGYTDKEAASFMSGK
jgi:hypothetical protein